MKFSVFLESDQRNCYWQHWGEYFSLWSKPSIRLCLGSWKMEVLWLSISHKVKTMILSTAQEIMYVLSGTWSSNILPSNLDSLCSFRRYLMSPAVAAISDFTDPQTWHTCAYASHKWLLWFVFPQGWRVAGFLFFFFFNGNTKVWHTTLYI